MKTDIADFNDDVLKKFLNLGWTYGKLEIGYTHYLFYGQLEVDGDIELVMLDVIKNTLFHMNKLVFIKDFGKIKFFKGVDYIDYIPQVKQTLKYVM